MNISRDKIRVMIYYDYKKKTDYYSKNALNLYEKHLITLAFRLQQFTIGMLHLIGEEINLKTKFVLIGQEVQSLEKTL